MIYSLKSTAYHWEQLALHVNWLVIETYLSVCHSASFAVYFPNSMAWVLTLTMLQAGGMSTSIEDSFPTSGKF